MKNLLLKLLKIFLILAGVLIVVSLVFGLVLLMDWPLWVGFFLLLIVIGMGIGVIFLRKVWLRQREKKFVQQVIEQDEAQLKTFAGKEKDELKDLQDRWREAIETLRHSHLKRHGNPLYVLPWYLLMGESGTGKTTALNSARLSSPFAEVSKTSGISGTRNCDWWFFEQAIIIDTAGRYTLPVDAERDKGEWQNFLTLLAKYRKREPLNGLIMTVAADKLLSATPEALQEEGKDVRKRIDELMRVLGAKFPVYVLVTKCDLIQGMAQFCEQLPEKSLEQPMGVINQDLSTDVMDFLGGAIETIGERLRNLRILLVHKPESKLSDPGFILFPEEFEHLKQGLVDFMKGAFKENPYQETPILRGLFFSSGRQEGTPYSHFLKALGLIGEKEVLPGTSQGLFLHDFFSKVLPKDRGLFTPTKRAAEWNSLTRNLGLISWIVLVIALCGLLSFSFVKNLRAIRGASHEFAPPPVLQGEFYADLMTMDRFGQALLNVEKQNSNWWIPRFGLDESIKIEKKLKEKYCNQFQNEFLVPFDKQMALVISHMTSSTPDEMTGEYTVHLVRRINLLRARLDEKKYETLMSQPQPFYVQVSATVQQGAEQDVRKKFGSLYLYYLVWRSDTVEINKEIESLQSMLKGIVSSKRTNLQWVTSWVDREGTVPSLTLADFWAGSLTVADERPIQPSFTRKGKEMMDSIIKEFESALGDPGSFTSTKAEFERWYRPLCFNAWQQFAANFSRGVERLNGMKEWQRVAEKMATDEGPYFAFINRAAQDLVPLTTEGNLPPWLQMVYKFQLVKNQGLVGGLTDKTKQEGGKLFSKIGKFFGKKADQIVTSPLESQAASAKAFQDYQTALSTLSQMVSSRAQAYQMALQTYSEDPAVGKSPFSGANESLSRLRANMVKGQADDDSFWRLLNGPSAFFWAYARMETACYLQTQWEEKVLSETQGASDQQAVEYLLSQEGPVSKFIKGPAAPFIGWNIGKGYYAKEVLGGSVPIETSFFNFLSKGAKSPAAASKKQNYSVTIKGLPTDVNPDARIKPHSTLLELQCSGNTFNLTNQNYPVSKTFTWSPETCNDVTFQIEVGDATLIKRYTGTQAFPEFLKDFQGGHKTFSPQDFPESASALDRLKIKFIKVNYQFSGEDRVLEQVKPPLPGGIPQKIAQCWQ
jgi:type VI secretion system protein ImpL